jgi:hypothetical protein
MTSNFTPAAFFLLNSSARNWKVLSWLVPTAAIRPDSGSSHAILTVSPFWARAPAALAARMAAVAIFRVNFTIYISWSNRIKKALHERTSVPCPSPQGLPVRGVPGSPVSIAQATAHFSNFYPAVGFATFG